MRDEMTVNFAYVPGDDGGGCVDGDRLSLACFECSSTQSLEISSMVTPTCAVSRDKYRSRKSANPDISRFGRRPLR